jgi:beta-glucosidase
MRVPVVGLGGRGLADPLFGGTSNTGKLPVSWPRTLAQQPISVGDRDYDPLYPRRFGLRTK